MSNPDSLTGQITKGVAFTGFSRARRPSSTAHDGGLQGSADPGEPSQPQRRTLRRFVTRGGELVEVESVIRETR